MASPSMPGTAYVLFHHVMGETDGKRGVWGYVRGGMGGPHPGAGPGRARPRRGDPLRRRGEPHPRARRPGDGRGAGGRRRVSRSRRGQQRRRPRDVHTPARPASAAAGVPGRRGPDQLRQRLAEDQRGPRRAAELPRLPRHRARPAAPRHHPHLSRPRLHRTGLRRRQVRPAVRAPRPRVHDPVGGRSDRGAARASTSCRSSCSTRPTRLREGDVGRARRGLRRPLLRPARRVRAQLPPRGAGPPGADAARPGADLQPDRRQHLPGRDDPEPALLLPARARLRRLPHARGRPLPLRGRRPSRRRRHGRPRLERGPRDPRARAAASAGSAFTR